MTAMQIQAGTEGMLVGTVFSDQAGTLNIDQSFDGVNWDVTNLFTVVGGTGQTISQVIFAPNLQVRYTNGGTTQGAFRLFLRTSGSRI